MGIKGYRGKKLTISDFWSEHFEFGAWIADYSNNNIMTHSLIIFNLRIRHIKKNISRKLDFHYFLNFIMRNLK
jgi:hypothetical protein